MSKKLPLTFFWFRRDLRLDDNAGLYHALKAAGPVQALFIFDSNILNKLEDKTDRRVQFIHQELERLNEELKKYDSSLLVKIGEPLQVWKELLEKCEVKSVYTNHDYEPYAITRDKQVEELLKEHSASFFTYKDQVVFEKHEVIKDDGKPYTVFTPYSKKWLAKLSAFSYKPYPTLKYAAAFHQTAPLAIPTLQAIDFTKTAFQFPPGIIKAEMIKNYSANRDYPAINGTSKLSIHLRFGTLSIRQLLAYAKQKNQTYVNELIWRDFYQMILFHFPQVVTKAFKPAYDNITWINNEENFKAWCEGKTGYPLVDAGMRELNTTGFMHNRVRMVVASFLTKHLLTDWRWGEAYFAEKLLDFELASNNGGWQWASGSGTDAAPYFRVFNPQLQLERFDPKLEYVKRWIPEYGNDKYPAPIVVHAMARDRMLVAYKTSLNQD
ncbi:MAG: deoxyribodipyrimidine photolyase [Bacteroidota bacterium]|nr:deoxyribodipyrimidine photolyase [Bacteroidota bacterium]